MNDKKNHKSYKVLMKCTKLIFVSIFSSRKFNDLKITLNAENKSSSYLINLDIKIELDLFFQFNKNVLTSNLLSDICSVNFFDKFEYLSRSSNGSIIERVNVESPEIVQEFFDNSSKSSLCSDIRLKLFVSVLSNMKFNELLVQVKNFLHLLHIILPKTTITFFGNETIIYTSEVYNTIKSGKNIDGLFEISTDASKYVIETIQTFDNIDFSFAKPRLIQVSNYLKCLDIKYLVLKVAVGMVPLPPARSNDPQLRLFLFSPYNIPACNSENLPFELDKCRWWDSLNIQLNKTQFFSGPVQPYSSFNLLSCNKDDINYDFVTVVCIKLLDPERFRTCLESIRFQQWFEKNIHNVLLENFSILQVSLKENFDKTVQMSKETRKHIKRDLSVVNVVNSVKDVLVLSTSHIFRETCLALMKVNDLIVFETEIFKIVSETVDAL